MSLNLDKSTWKRVAFGDVIENVTDRVDDPSSAGVDRYVGLEHLDPGILTVERWDSPNKVEAQKLRFQPGDVIFGRRRAYQKKVARADFDGICSAHALVLRARPDVMQPDFLPVFLASDYFLDRAIAISVGSLSPTVNWRDLRVEQFDLPPLDDQKRIADLLWACEQERAAGKLLLDRFDSVMGVWADELFRCGPWDDEVMGDLLEVCQYGLSTRAGETGQYPMLRMTNLEKGWVTDADLKFCDLSQAEFDAHQLVDGDLLFNRTNSVELVGRSGVFRLAGDFVFASYLIRLRPDSGVLLPDYLNLFINSPTGQGRIRRHLSKGVSQANISASKLKTVSLPVPPLDEQGRVIEQFQLFGKYRDTIVERVTAAASLRNETLRQLFGDHS